MDGNEDDRNLKWCSEIPLWALQAGPKMNWGGKSAQKRHFPTKGQTKDVAVKQQNQGRNHLEVQVSEGNKVVYQWGLCWEGVPKQKGSTAMEERIHLSEVWTGLQR